jgi:hypothetical protein
MYVWTYEVTETLNPNSFYVPVHIHSGEIEGVPGSQVPRFPGSQVPRWYQVPGDPPMSLPVWKFVVQVQFIEYIIFGISILCTVKLYLGSSSLHTYSLPTYSPHP